MRLSRLDMLLPGLVLAGSILVACAASDAPPPNHNASGGTGGLPDSGTSGSGGTAGSGGTSGSGGTAGSGGSAGAAGSAGTSGGGGVAGSAGAAGMDGGAGASGSAGTDGGAGTGGSAGGGGSAGSGGSAGTAGSDAAAPYRHTISIDGTNDFTASAEGFTTTSTGYTAYVTWDNAALYVGYDGADIGAGATTKWLFVYVDVDPGTSSGSTTGEKYNTEEPSFPSGFRADAYFAWRTDGAYSKLVKYSGGAWSIAGSNVVTSAHNGTYVEMRIPFTDLGVSSPTKLGLVTLMMNEVNGAEAAYAGLYSGSFTDGYHASVPVTYSLLADMASAASPNDAANRKP